MLAVLLLACGASIWVTIIWGEIAATRDRTADGQIAAEVAQYFTPGVCKRAATIFDGRANAVILSKLVAAAGGATAMASFIITTFSRGGLISRQTWLFTAAAIIIAFSLRQVRVWRRAADIAIVAAD
jgi:hypothetical protein